MAINTFKRKEIKFLLNTKQFNGLMSIIPEYMNPDKYCVGGEEYGIYNIYYDTPDSFLIKESLSKPYYKEKLRLRSYFSPASPEDTVFLEIKKKIGGIVTKRRVTMTLAEAEAYMTYGARPETDKYISKQVLDEIDVLKHNHILMPAHYISYQRTAFFGKNDSEFRITFDRAIRERTTDLSLSSKCYGSQIIRPDQRLMEIKVADSIPMWLSSCLSEYGIYKSSFSKYGKAYQYHVLDNINNHKGESIYA